MIQDVNREAPVFKRRVIVEFKDDNGKMQRGALKSNNGRMCKVLANSTTYVVSRRQINFVKE